MKRHRFTHKDLGELSSARIVEMILDERKNVLNPNTLFAVRLKTILGYIDNHPNIFEQEKLLSGRQALLEACEHVRDNLKQESEEVWEHEIAHLEYAIKKAEDL